MDGQRAAMQGRAAGRAEAGRAEAGRIEAARPGVGRAWTILAAIALGRMAFGFQIQTVASIAPELLARLGLDYTALGTLIGLYLAPGVVLALPAGLLARRLGDRTVVGGGLALMTVGAGICAAAGGAWGIGAGRMVCGAGAVALVVLQAKIIADWFVGRAFMVALSASIGAYPIGVGVGQLVQGRLAAQVGWQAAFLAGGVIAGAAAILFLASYRPAPGAPGRSSASFPGPRECALVIVAGCLWTAYNAGYLGFLSYVPSLLAARGATAGLVGLAITLATWCNVPALFAGSALAVRFGSWPVYLVATLALSGSVAGMAAFGWPLAWAAGAWAAAFGLLGSMHCSVIIALGTTSTRPEHRAVGMGLFYTTYYVGGGLLPMLFGRAADVSGGPAGALYAAAAFSLLGIPAFWLHRLLGNRRAAMAAG